MAKFGRGTRCCDYQAFTGYCYETREITLRLYFEVETLWCDIKCYKAGKW